jgi:hypothetical protein
MADCGHGKSSRSMGQSGPIQIDIGLCVVDGCQWLAGGRRERLGPLVGLRVVRPIRMGMGWFGLAG